MKWTQWIFCQLFEKGLARQEEALVNWCPKLGTVLANEEVIGGKSERGDHPVVRTPLRQWVLEITKYADRLLTGLDGLDWPKGTVESQRQWIGRSEGCTVRFGVGGGEDVEVFTTRCDTLMGVTYVCLAPEHRLVADLTKEDRKEDVEAYVARAASRSDMDRAAGKEKTGVFTGSYAVHPVTGEEVQVWVADYVLGGYGTGAVMAVPAHDARDYEFAEEFGLPVKAVVGPKVRGEPELPFLERGVCVDSGEFSGLETKDALKAVANSLEDKGRGGPKVQYKLRDWLFSRQRYWGEPIPIYFPVTDLAEGSDPKNSPHSIDFATPIAVDASELPLTLPPMDDFHPGDDPAGCLARAKDWRYFQRDGKWYARETNTMPQWAGSCWYYFRFADPSNSASAWSHKADEGWLPVDLYVGGAEHAVLHLLYARFWHHVLHDLGHTRHPEPFAKLVHQGMILGADGEKMSKSRGNVVNPDDVVEGTGADSLRLYEMFMGPLEAVKPWQTSQVAGVVRFQRKVYDIAKRVVESPRADDAEDAKETLKVLHKCMKKVTSDVESMSFNTAISALMVLSNHLASLPEPPSKDTVMRLAVMLSPFAPHLAEEVHEMLGGEGSVSKLPWVEVRYALAMLGRESLNSSKVI